MGASSKAGSFAAKVLGIDLDASTRHQTQELDEHLVRSISPHEPYYEEDPTVKEWLLEHVPTKDGSVRYVKSLFPFTKWIFRYNTRWLVSDVIAGKNVQPRTMLSLFHSSTDNSQVLRSGSSSFPKRWPTPSSPVSAPNMVFTHPSLVQLSTGSLVHQRTSR